MKQMYLCWSNQMITHQSVSSGVTVSVHMSETIRRDSHFSCWQVSFWYREDGTRFSISLCRPESGQMCERKFPVMQVSNCKIMGKYLRNAFFFFAAVKQSAKQLVKETGKTFWLKAQRFKQSFDTCNRMRKGGALY